MAEALPVAENATVNLHRIYNTIDDWLVGLDTVSAHVPCLEQSRQPLLRIYQDKAGPDAAFGVFKKAAYVPSANSWSRKSFEVLAAPRNYLLSSDGDLIIEAFFAHNNQHVVLSRHTMDWPALAKKKGKRLAPEDLPRIDITLKLGDPPKSKHDGRRCAEASFLLSCSDLEAVPEAVRQRKLSAGEKLYAVFGCCISENAFIDQTFDLAQSHHYKVVGWVGQLELLRNELVRTQSALQTAMGADEVFRLGLERAINDHQQLHVEKRGRTGISIID